MTWDDLSGDDVQPVGGQVCGRKRRRAEQGQPTECRARYGDLGSHIEGVIVRMT